MGQSIVSFAEGRVVDTVKDLLISETNDSIVALLVDEGGLLSSSRVVPLEAVDSFGRDAVVIRDAQAVTTASADPEVKAILNRKEQLLGKRVLTDQGDAMGSISDMYFDEKNGQILGFEVSGGLLGDVARGTSYLAVEEIERMGPDVIFVRPETGENLEGQVGGVMGTLDQAGKRLGDAAHGAQDQIQAQISEGHPERALIGRRSGADVTDADGSIVVANGQRIRPEHVEWAQQTDNMDLLTRAAARGEARETRARAGAAMEEAGDNLGAMWDRFTKRISEMRDEHGRQVDEQQTRTRLAQIADAIGRPVGKVILDRSDNVILDFGDIITHQAVQQAYDAGMLDTLLASAYRAEFGLPLEELRAKQRASATIEQAHGGAEVVDELEQKVQQRERERAEREQRERSEAEAAAQARERERAERTRARQQSEQQRQREVDEARQPSDPDATAEYESPAASGRS
ncbi:MAG: PRC-barrel domain-containing protein [Chloroflexota bacterium]|nr:PRC-barrel domain-containing protein [Chloroflexota bacterium]